MPKGQKQARNVTKPFRFTGEEKLRLLAWLDHCIQYEIEFNTSVASYMSSTAQRAPTQRQCLSKLSRLWRAYRLNGYTSVRSQGSASISLSDSERARVQQICDELKGSLTESRGSSPLSSLRSTPSVPDSYACLVQLERDSGQQFADGTSSSVTLDICNEQGVGAEKPQLLAREYVSRSIGVQSSDTFSVEAKKNAEFLAQKEERLVTQQHQIYHLKSELDTTRTQYDKLVRAIDGQGDSAYNAQVVARLRNDNSSLKRQLEDFRAAQSDKERLTKSESLGPTHSQIHVELGWLEDRLTKTCSKYGYSPSTAQPLSDESDHLRRLIERVSSKSIQDFNAYISSTRISEYQLARALSAAIVCELAFESPFPESLGSDSLLLHGYREQLFLQNGVSALKSLDLLAHKSIISDPYFLEKLIPEKSRDMALETFQLLSQWNPCENRTQTPDQPSRAPRNDLLQSVFTKALKLKARLLLSKSRYAFVFPAAGARFDSGTMQRHRFDQEDSGAPNGLDDPLTQQGGEAEVKFIKLCLFPALYAYPKTADEEALRSIKTDLEKHLVDYRKFDVNDIESMKGETILISKAVVQL
ncbi:hypothetical protein NPX13_g5301 [Xylaria arbuscula]|uniref:Uncharacterized protein n=1 Tax=Xylaria arbuscula TaxID=114810 RepID=A0A9W8NEN0_9PEZI|nr:hypothetical protein NPX13_g5301 [Xylaria arbuscula]